MYLSNHNTFFFTFFELFCTFIHFNDGSPKHPHPLHPFSQDVPGQRLMDAGRVSFATNTRLLVPWLLGDFESSMVDVI